MNRIYPLVSIVTPTYNQADYLAETIESVLAQDYPNIEYLVLDDGSTDATSDVLKAYGDRVRWERHENMGQARTVNKGWASSRGEVIGYINSDDVLLPGAVSCLVAALQSSDEAVVAYCDFDLIDASSRYLRTVYAEDFNLYRLAVDLICQPGPGALFRRSAFDRSGGWRTHLQQVPDFDLWLRIANYGSFVRVPHVLAKYRVHASSASFRPISAARSMEVVHVVGAYWVTAGVAAGQCASMATAYTHAARSHLQSGRPGDALNCVAVAVKLNWRIGFKVSFWRALLAGAVRRFSYTWGFGLDRG